MVLLTIALSIFILTHLVPAFPALKMALIAKLGRTGYIAAFSTFSLFSLGLVIYAKIESPFIDVYAPPAWSRYFALTLMLPATILIVASFLPGHIRKIVRRPIFYATLLWVIAHLVANGDKASIVLFASLGIYAFVSEALMKKYRKTISPDDKKVYLWADITALTVGTFAYATLIYLHEYIIGVDIWY